VASGLLLGPRVCQQLDSDLVQEAGGGGERHERNEAARCEPELMFPPAPSRFDAPESDACSSANASCFFDNACVEGWEFAMWFLESVSSSNAMPCPAGCE
jgi:hypothetical protein